MGEAYFPSPFEFERAFRQVSPNLETVSIDLVFDQIERNAADVGIDLCLSWRQTLEEWLITIGNVRKI